MDAVWWQAPGPGAFVAAAVADLESGRNVVLRLPRPAADGLRAAVETRVRADERWRWRAIDAADTAAGSPAELAMALHRQLGCEPPPGRLASPAELARLVGGGDILWVDNLDEPRWPVWAKFLGLFQHACHARDETQRGLFCIPVVGPLPAEPEPDTALRAHRWGDGLSRLDVMFHLDRRCPRSDTDRVLRQVTLAVAAELAGTDIRLGARLAADGPAFFADYAKRLTQYAAEHGWTATSVQSASWGDGVYEVLDGETRVHSAALAAAERWDEVDRRVWQGQVRVLYPFIEEQRVKLIPAVAASLRFPIVTEYGERINRAIDLEIGPLMYHLKSQRIPQRTWNQLSLLRGMRHALAHLRPVDIDDLRSEAWRSLTW